MAKSVIVTGHRELDAKLMQIGPRIARKITRSALRNAAKTIMQGAQRNLSSNNNNLTGKLSRGMKVRAGKRSRTQISIEVLTTEEKRSPGSRYPYGGAQLETGTKTVKAQPFLRPAGYSNEPAIRRMVIADIESVLKTL